MYNTMKTYGKEKLIESVNPSRGMKSHAADIHTQTCTSEQNHE